MSVERSWAITPATRSGRPDYSEEVWKGATYHRIVLMHNEAQTALGLLLTDEPLLAPYAKAPLAPGATVRPVDVATGLDTPYTVPAGYTRSLMSYWWSFDQPIEAKSFVDGVHMSTFHEKVFMPHYEHDISTDYFGLDPTGALPHTFDYTFLNQGSRELKGYYMFTGKIIAVGTPGYPKTKTVRCTRCQHRHEVDRKASIVRCPVCRGITAYHPILFGGEQAVVVI